MNLKLHYTVHNALWRVALVVFNIAISENIQMIIANEMIYLLIHYYIVNFNLHAEL